MVVSAARLRRLHRRRASRVRSDCASRATRSRRRRRPARGSSAFRWPRGSANAAAASRRWRFPRSTALRARGSSRRWRAHEPALRSRSSRGIAAGDARRARAAGHAGRRPRDARQRRARFGSDRTGANAACRRCAGRGAGSLRARRAGRRCWCRSSAPDPFPVLAVRQRPCRARARRACSASFPRRSAGSIRAREDFPRAGPGQRRDRRLRRAGRRVARCADAVRSSS